MGRGLENTGRVIGLMVIRRSPADSAFADLLVQPLIVRMTVLAGQAIHERAESWRTRDPWEAEGPDVCAWRAYPEADSSWTDVRVDDPNFSKAVARSCIELADCSDGRDETRRLPDPALQPASRVPAGNARFLLRRDYLHDGANAARSPMARRPR